MPKTIKKSEKQRLLAEINRLKKELRKKKKYGLVWEDKPEDVVTLCKEKLPILKEVKNKEIKTDKEKPINLFIEGDNYHALSVLSYTHTKKIDLIYIDPPYNTGNKDFVFNDRYVDIEDSYRHSKWLSFMEKRLKLAKSLLKDDGALFVSISDAEYPRLTLLLEEVFKEDKVKTICVKMAEPTGVKMAHVINMGGLPKLKEYLVIAKKDGIRNLYLDKIPKEEWDNEYKTIITNITKEEVNKLKKIRDDQERTDAEIKICDNILGKLNAVSLSDYLKDKSFTRGKDIDAFKKDNAWRIIQIVSMSGSAKLLADRKRKETNKPFFSIITPRRKMYFIKNDYDSGQKIPRIKVLFADDYLSVHPGDFWQDIKTTGLDNEGGVDFKNGKKPLALMRRIIGSIQDRNATVLDFFAGSGTTGEAVLELNDKDDGNRQFIICTNNEAGVLDTCLRRLNNAIKGFKRKGGYGGNVKYFRTAFVDAEPTDKNKIKLTQQATEMLCIREGTFEKVLGKKDFKIFKNSSHYTGIIFDQLAIPEFKKSIKNIKGRFSVYVFSLSDETFDEEFADIKQKVKLSPIPEAILRVYRRIFK